MIIPELLSPAGNFEKLKSALNFGADAVYLSGKSFGMRAAADNFYQNELEDAITYVHEKNKRVYLTVNVMPHENEIEALDVYLREISNYKDKPDAFIVADLGVMEKIKNIFPEKEIHISTQAGAVNSLDCNVFYKLGAKRIILARELSFDDIKRIRDKTDPLLELEIFIHGSMCVSYSGRCLLSHHFTGRDANRGLCTQPCRWKYKLYEIEEEKRPGQRQDITENDMGTFIMSSRDMCMIEHIPDLCESGVSSLKIEGRVKSAYYAAVTANTYRMALDSYKTGNYVYNKEWLSELESVSHRPYCTGYFLTSPDSDAQLCENNSKNYIGERSFCASVISYDEKNNLAYCVQKNKTVLGNEAELLSPNKTGQKFIVSCLYDKDFNSITSTPHPEMNFYIKIPFSVLPGDIIRK